MSSDNMMMSGGCLCGEVRFEMEANSGDVVDYCHCSQCRKVSGAPVTAWIQVAPARFRLTKGVAQAFQSSAHATRWFCGRCGSTLQMSDPDHGSIGIPLGALDEPEAVRPTVHGWAGGRLSWLTLDDNLPAYDEAPPYDL